ncbi:ATP-binding protein [Candidatus Woesearchaeota archaeon]|nr:ATP-binding protein [Candidatus Woesearchaeota archaeon]
MEFYDRTNELKDLSGKYDEIDSGELCIIYGRRRLGKTEFIKRFMNEIDGEAVYYFVNKANKKELLRILSEDIYDQTGEREKFIEWEDFFEYLYKKASKQKFVFVMDEFSRLKDHAPEFLSKFQNYWDNKLSKSKILFVAIGSSMSMMYDIFMDKTAPLYGRMTWKMPFKPFRYLDFRDMFSDLDEKKRIEIYSVFGGTPHFLWFVKKHSQKELIQIIEKMVLRKTAPLRDEPTNFIMMELTKETNYNSILHAISTTNGTREEIVIQSGVEQKDVNYYLNNLKDLLHIIGTRDPLFHSKKPKPRYAFEDNFFHFWYKYIFSNLSLIELGNMELLREKINKDINSFIGHKFEDIVRELLILYNGKKIKNLKINFDQIGPWWGKNSDGKAEEIDLVVNNTKDRELIICEVKWKNTPVNIPMVEDLVRKSVFINASGSFKYLLISKSGFTKECIEYLDTKKMTYLTLEEISSLFEDAEKNK